MLILEKKSLKSIRKWQSTPVLLPGKAHGKKSLVGCSLWDHKESVTTEWLHFTRFLTQEEQNKFNANTRK